MKNMTVNPSTTHRCSFADECGKPRTSKGRLVERRTIKRRERQAWKQEVAA